MSKRAASWQRRTCTLWIVSLSILFCSEMSFSQNNELISVHTASTNEVKIVLQNSVHQKYGCAYPITFHFYLPASSNGLTVNKKYFSADIWTIVPEKTSNDYFNGVEAVRFEYEKNSAYVSVAFSSESDSLFLEFNDGAGSPITAQYLGISKYYDNRQAAVTVTADDWADWSNPMWSSLLTLFRSYGLFVTTGVISENPAWTSSQTWKHIQQQLDSGFIEIASHSRTHPQIPYANYSSEVYGSYDDILNYLELPNGFRKGTKEYVYVWVAPYGGYDVTVDSMVSVKGYLVSRLYFENDTATAEWDSRRSMFTPIGLTLEIGLPSWGGGTADTVFMNSKFNSTVQSGGLYHLMWHPQVIYDDQNKPYIHSHLKYISGRKNIWYANLGHVYLNKLLQQPFTLLAMRDEKSTVHPTGYSLYQNYPNPFNPRTRIAFNIPVDQSRQAGTVSLKVFDILGKEIATLVNERLRAGTYEIDFDASLYPSGAYVYRLSAGNVMKTKKMMLIK